MVGCIEHENLDDFVSAVGRTIEKHALIEPGQTVLVGLSGGADSVCLLATLVKLNESGLGAKLIVGHLDHSLRAESQSDCQFSRELAEGFGLEFISRRVDVKAFAAEAGIGTEEAARQVRYEFFQSVAQDKGVDRVALGHHADDNVETILFRIIRGTHLRGLAGIPIRRSLGCGPAEIIRPLLDIRSDQIRQYLSRRCLEWREDETNTDSQYRRNFIRGELLPLLRDRLNPRVDEAVIRLGQSAGQAEDLASTLACSALAGATISDKTSPDKITLDAAKLASQHSLVRTHVIRTALERIGTPMQSVTSRRFSDIDELLTGASDSAITLGGGFVVTRPDGLLVIAKQAAPDEAPSWSVQLSVPGRTELPCGGSVTCSIEPVDGEAFKAHCLAGNNSVQLLDADKITEPLACRTRRDGDIFRPLGCPGRQTVSDFLTNMKLTSAERANVRCICDSQGIIFLAPLRMDSRAAVTDHTERVLRIKYARDKDPTRQV